MPLIPTITFLLRKRPKDQAHDTNGEPLDQDAILAAIMANVSGAWNIFSRSVRNARFGETERYLNSLPCLPLCLLSRLPIAQTHTMSNHPSEITTMPHPGDVKPGALSKT